MCVGKEVVGLPEGGGEVGTVDVLFSFGGTMDWWRGLLLRGLIEGAMMTSGWVL